MARIESLNLINSAAGKEYLAETYGKVIANVAKKTIASKLKNTDLSGTPTAGSIEAKRFVNAESKAYGTARTNGKADAVKADPVTIQINTNKELIEEVETKDVTLYGVDNFIARKAASHEGSMVRELERAFFTEAGTAGTEVTLAGATPEEQLEELIQAVETVKNDYVDGVDRSMITVVLTPALYGKVRTYLDKVDMDGKAEAITMYHGANVESSTYLPTGVNAIAMAEGSVAQPVLPTVDEADKIPLSNAYHFGLFYSYGTKAVAPDLIFVAKTNQG